MTQMDVRVRLIDRTNVLKNRSLYCYVNITDHELQIMSWLDDWPIGMQSRA